MTQVRLRRYAIAVVCCAVLAGGKFFANEHSPVPAAFNQPDMAKALAQTGRAIGEDTALSNRCALVLYGTMLGWPNEADALDVFEKTGAVIVVRQALLTNELHLLVRAAEFFERTKDPSGLPELVNALERKSFHWGALSEGMGQGLLQQGLIRAIGAVTGRMEEARAILPENRLRQIEPKVIDQFVEGTRRWARDHEVELYPPAEVQPWPQTEPPPPPSLDDQLDGVIGQLNRKEPSLREDAAKRLRATRDRIDDVLTEYGYNSPK